MTPRSNLTAEQLREWAGQLDALPADSWARWQVTQGIVADMHDLANEISRTNPDHLSTSSNIVS